MVAIGFRMNRFCAGVSIVAFLNSVFGVAGVSYKRSALTFRYGGDSTGLFIVSISVDFRSIGLCMRPSLNGQNGGKKIKIQNE